MIARLIEWVWLLAHVGVLNLVGLAGFGRVLVVRLHLLKVGGRPLLLVPDDNDDIHDQEDDKGDEHLEVLVPNLLVDDVREICHDCIRLAVRRLVVCHALEIGLVSGGHDKCQQHEWQLNEFSDVLQYLLDFLDSLLLRVSRAGDAGHILSAEVVDLADLEEDRYQYARYDIDDHDYELGADHQLYVTF